LPKYAILSQHPITRSQELNIYNRGGLIAVLATPLAALTVASYHPHPPAPSGKQALAGPLLCAAISTPAVRRTPLIAGN